jgi:hypothetical protein
MSLAPPSARTGLARRARRGLTAALAIGLLAPVGLAAPAAADVPTTEPAPAAAGWIAEHLAAQDAPAVNQLADAVIAYAAAGSAGDLAAETFAEVETLAADAAGQPANLVKIILAASAQGEDPTDLDGFDAVDSLLGTLTDDGAFGSRQLFIQSIAILALESTDAGAPDAAVDYLAEGACPDGTYNFAGDCDTRADADVTAVAAQALLAAGRDVSVQVDWLLAQQLDDGAFASSYGDANANTTALAAQVLRAAGESGAADDAAGFVASLQRGCDVTADRGAFRTYPEGVNDGADGSLFLATTQGVFAWSAPMHELDASTSAPETAYLACPEPGFCPTDAGISVVVDFTELAPETGPRIACVTDVPGGASGLDLLELAGFATTTQDFGGDLGEALCTIEGLPVLDEGTCFGDGFWSYWNADRGGDWTPYQIGAGASTPAEGSVEGFVWASGDAGQPRVDPVPQPTPPFDRGIAAACPGTYPNPFTDITGSVHEGAIRCLAAADVTRGTSDPTIFGRARDVTRAQVASFLVRAYEESTGDALPAGPDRFPDDDGSVHEANIDALAAAGVIRGVGDGSEFAPGASLTRAQMATFIDRFLDLLDDGELDRSFPAATRSDVFADDTGSVHAPAIDRLAVTGVVSGLRSGGYGPQDEVTREQVASFIARGLDLAVSQGRAAPVG